MIPKYRAWDVHNKKMFTESELVIWHGNVYANDYQKIFKMFMEGARGLVGYSIDDKYLMQSTWIKDKNGQEIFEGDIVEFEDADDIENVYINQGVIEWCQGGFTVSNRTTVTLDDLLDEDTLEVTIVGNIYDNPELLDDWE